MTTDTYMTIRKEELEEIWNNDPDRKKNKTYDTVRIKKNRYHSRYPDKMEYDTK